MLTQIAKVIKRDGVLLTSGIIDFKENEVRQALESHGFTILEINHEGEWVSIVAKRNA